MIAFDADILSELFRGSSDYVRRAEAIPADQQAIPVVVVEEVLRGRLNEIRRAEGGKSRISIERAYDLLQETFLSSGRDVPFGRHRGGTGGKTAGCRFGMKGISVCPQSR